jgi:NhaP-type Na+/H+ or K+/H+ antiporter
MLYRTFLMVTTAFSVTLFSLPGCDSLIKPFFQKKEIKKVQVSNKTQPTNVTYISPLHFSGI